MRFRVVLMLLLAQVLGTSVCLSAQDKRTVTEPKLPADLRRLCRAAQFHSVGRAGHWTDSIRAERGIERRNSHAPRQIEAVRERPGG